MLRVVNLPTITTFAEITISSFMAAQKILCNSATSFFLALLLVSQNSIAGVAEIDKLLALPEKEIDVGIAALTLAKELHPDMDIAAYSKQIDLLVQKANQLAKGTTNPDQRIRVLNTLFFQLEGYQYDHSESAANKIENQSLKGILDTKKGMCITMPLLYMAVAQRLDYPVYPVTAPNHMFLRYVNPSLKMQNIEATGGGGYSPDEHYIREMRVSKKGMTNGAHMKTMTYRQLVAHLTGQTAVALYKISSDIDKTIIYTESASRNFPEYPEFYINLKQAYKTKILNADPKSAKQYQQKIAKYAAMAEKFGYVRTTQDYVRRKNGAEK
jgi:regulator of sirC expression with transglutaminase-like and TPR domain